MSKLTALDRGVRKSVHTDRVSSQNKISLKSMSGENSNLFCSLHVSVGGWLQNTFFGPYLEWRK